MKSGNSNRPVNPHHIHQTPRVLPISNLYNLPQSNLPTLQINPDSHHHLRDEVIYLHSLWHRGPPSQTPTSLFLRPSTSIYFKKTMKPPKILNPLLISDKEWPVQSKPPSPSPSGSAWPEFKPVLTPVSRPATSEERDRVLGVKIHLKGLDLCSGLVRGVGSSGVETRGDDNDDDDDEACDHAEEYEFLMKVFEENGELREFYEKKSEGGDFYCLVCGVLVNKLRKKYKNCVALVQHCFTISKTKKKAAHRALAHVICMVLGWDVNRLPSLPSTTVGDADGQSLEKSCEVQSESKNLDGVNERPSESKNNVDGHVAGDNEGLKTDEVYQNSENVQLEQNFPCVISGESIDCRSLLEGDATT